MHGNGRILNFTTPSSPAKTFPSVFHGLWSKGPLPFTVSQPPPTLDTAVETYVEDVEDRFVVQQKWCMQRHRPGILARKNTKCETITTTTRECEFETKGNKPKPNVFDCLKSRHYQMQQMTLHYPQAVALTSFMSTTGTRFFKRPLWTASMETIPYRASGYMMSSGSLLHHAEQIEYLVQTKQLLPLDFLSISRSYRQIAWDYFEGRLEKGEQHNYEGCCFVPSLAEFQQMHWTYNSLLYLPPPISRSAQPTTALRADIDWPDVELRFNRGEIVQVDGVLSEWTLQAAYDYSLEATIWWECKRGFLGAYGVDGLLSSNRKNHLGIMNQITEELRQALPSIIGADLLENFWSYKYNNNILDLDKAFQNGKGERITAQTGISVHADGAKVNMNMWLTPDHACMDKEAGGMTIYDFGVDTAELFRMTQDNTNHDRLLEMVRLAGSKMVTIPYQRNRMLLFNSKLLHQTGTPSRQLIFKKGYENRRISLTWLWGKLIDRDTGMKIS